MLTQIGAWSIWAFLLCSVPESQVITLLYSSVLWIRGCFSFWQLRPGTGQLIWHSHSGTSLWCPIRVSKGLLSTPLLLSALHLSLSSVDLLCCRLRLMGCCPTHLSLPSASLRTLPPPPFLTDFVLPLFSHLQRALHVRSTSDFYPCLRRPQPPLPDQRAGLEI